MMQQHTIHIAGGVVRNPLVRLTEPVTLDFLAGEHIAIVGPNGAGKSLLVDMLTEKYPLRDGELTYDFSPSLTKTAYDNIKYIAFREARDKEPPKVSVCSKVILSPLLSVAISVRLPNNPL